MLTQLYISKVNKKKQKNNEIISKDTCVCCMQNKLQNEKKTDLKTLYI